MRWRALYYSSSIFENADADHPTLPNAIIIGLHGPRIHSSPNIDLAMSPFIETILLTDGEKMLSDAKILTRLSILKDRGVKIPIDRIEYEIILGK